MSGGLFGGDALNRVVDADVDIDARAGVSATAEEDEPDDGDDREECHNGDDGGGSTGASFGHGR